MIEIPLIGLIMVMFVWGLIGFMTGSLVHLATKEGRRRRALNRVTPVWEVHVGSDGTDYGYGVIGTGHAAIVQVRKVRRAGQHFELLQKIEVARVSGDADPDRIMAAVDRAQLMIQTLTLTGAA